MVSINCFLQNNYTSVNWAVVKRIIYYLKIVTESLCLSIKCKLLAFLLSFIMSTLSEAQALQRQQFGNCGALKGLLCFGFSFAYQMRFGVKRRGLAWTYLGTDGYLAGRSRKAGCKDIHQKHYQQPQTTDTRKQMLAYTCSNSQLLSRNCSKTSKKIKLQLTCN